MKLIETEIMVSESSRFNFFSSVRVKSKKELRYGQKYLHLSSNFQAIFLFPTSFITTDSLKIVTTGKILD